MHTGKKVGWRHGLNKPLDIGPDGQIEEDHILREEDYNIGDMTGVEEDED